MPRNALRNLSHGTSSAAPTAPGAAPVDPPSAQAPDLLPDELRSLLDERRVLEARMAELTGGRGASPGTQSSGTNPRFPVTPLRERRQADADWAAERSRQGEALRQSRRTAPTAGAVQDHFGDPPERTGQSALRGLSDGALRTSLRDVLGLPDHTPELPDPALPNRTRTELPNLDDRLQNARRRLDILTGGSGELDQLRQTALQRARARRSDEDRDAARHQTGRRSNRHDDPDSKRDAARLDRQPRGRRKDRLDE